MEALIPWVPVLAPFINFVLIPIYKALRGEIQQLRVDAASWRDGNANLIAALRNENNALQQKVQSLQVVLMERIGDLEVQLHRDFCRRESCDRLKTDLAARQGEGRH